MDELLPHEAAVVAYERTVAQIDELQAYEPKTDAERRRCASELIKLRQAQVDLAQRVIQEDAGRQIAQVIGNDYTKPTDAARVKGNSNGHAPAADINWGPVIGQVAADCEKQIAAFKEDLAAKKSGALGPGEIKALAQGLVPYLNERLAEAVNPLIERIAELEARPLLEDGGTWSPEKFFRPNQVVTYRGAAWVCRHANQDMRPGKSDAFRLLHKTVGGGRED